MVINGFLECLLNSEGQFGWPAYAGLLVPLTTATVVLFAGKTYGVLMLCIGTLIGQFLQLCIIILRTRRSSSSINQSRLAQPRTRCYWDGRLASTF